MIVDRCRGRIPLQNFVRVETSFRDGQVRVSVRDTGPGIPDDVRDRVFRAQRNLPPDVDPPSISKADAEEKMIAMRQEMVRSPGKEQEARDEGNDREMEAKKKRYMRFVEEIEGAVKAGKLTEEQAWKKWMASIWTISAFRM